MSIMFHLFLLLFTFPTVSPETIEMGNKLLELPLNFGYVGPIGCVGKKKNCDDRGAEASLISLSEAIESINQDRDLIYFHNITIKSLDSSSSNSLRATVNGMVDSSLIA
ncbi:hypothetical protein PFISCL1PPCAC_6173, partial [Pristionchus fissidentatus]